MPPKKNQTASLCDTWGRNNRKLPNRNCKNCGVSFRPVNKKILCCSRKCGYDSRGKYQKNKRGGVYRYKNKRGYILMTYWDGDRKINTREHRYIMEQHIGRKLEAWEDVHHKNGIRDDNRIENLEILPHEVHTSLHSKGNTYARGKKIVITESDRKGRSDRMKQYWVKYREAKALLNRK